VVRPVDAAQFGETGNGLVRVRELEIGHNSASFSLVAMSPECRLFLGDPSETVENRLWGC
jgi:hypothetical protein